MRSAGQPLTRPLRAVAGRFACSRAEAVALAVLMSGALAALALLWRLAAPAPLHSAAPMDVVTATEPVEIVAEDVVVHVAGEVVAPGLYRLAAGSRVADALEAAGGPTPEASLDAVNLARPLTDGEQLLVPTPGAVAAPDGADPAAGGAGAGSAWRPDGTLDLNLATQADLEELPGIGPVMAQRILDHREAVGRFQTVGDLRAVSGVGEKRFQQLAPLVGV